MMFMVLPLDCIVLVQLMAGLHAASASAAAGLTCIWGGDTTQARRHAMQVGAAHGYQPGSTTLCTACIRGHQRATAEAKIHSNTHTLRTWVTGCIWNREGSHTVGGPEGRRRLPPDFLSFGRIFRHLSCRIAGEQWCSGAVYCLHCVARRVGA